MVIVIAVIVICILAAILWVLYSQPAEKTQTVKVIRLERFENVIPSQSSPEEVVVFEPEDIVYYDPPLEEIPFDSQNVHDTNIVKSTAINMANLKDSGLAGIPFAKFIDTLDVHTRDIITQIRSRNATVITLGKTEYEVLLQVYESCRGEQLLLDELVFQIKDCIENDRLVCATGVVTRLLSTSIIKNPEQGLVTETIIREIILSKAGLLQSEGHEYDEIPEILLVEYPDYAEIITKLFTTQI